MDICPPRFIYDIMEQRLVLNPDGRVAAGDQCVEECPRMCVDVCARERVCVCVCVRVCVHVRARARACV